MLSVKNSSTVYKQGKLLQRYKKDAAKSQKVQGAKALNLLRL